MDGPIAEDAFEPPTPLARRIMERIRRFGPITFAAFVEACLYDPLDGYYRRGAPVVGRDGDFVTAPESHPAFGRLVGRWVAEGLAATDDAADTVLEQGAGNGSLAAGVLETLATVRPDTRYLIVEPDPAWQARQAERLAAFERQVSWAADLAQLGSGSLCGVVVTNELLDAFPVHRVVNEKGVLRELWVHVEAERFIERPGALSTPVLAVYFHRLGFLPLPERPVEVNLAMLDWLGDVRRVLGAGWVLTFDYGAEARELYLDERRAGTLRAYRNQVVLEDPYVHVGGQDLTADVDFTSLALQGEALGLQQIAYRTQRELLIEAGWQGWFDRAATDEERRSLQELVDENLMGDTRVLEQRVRPESECS